MAEFTYNPVQTVEAGQNVILNNSISCSKGYVFHRNESGIVILRGIVNNPSNEYARYQVTFNANIAVPEGGTAGEISVALAVDGEIIPTSLASVTPTVVDSYFNVTSTKYITVPKGCCFTLSVENASTSITGETPTPASPINVRNANLVVTRTA